MFVLLDVGAHYGQTAILALDPKWGFDVIHAFEPSKIAFLKLAKLRSKRLRLHNFGLYSSDCTLELKNSGEIRASVYSRNLYLESANLFETVKLKKASAWCTNNLSLTDDLYLKLNCEGSEVDILQDLIDSDYIKNFKAIYIDFDIRKIPGEEYRRKIIEDQLFQHEIKFQSWEEIQGLLTNGEKNIPYFSFSKWLEINKVQDPVGTLEGIKYFLNVYLGPIGVFKKLVKWVLPNFINRYIVKLLQFLKMKRH